MHDSFMPVIRLHAIKLNYNGFIITQVLIGRQFFLPSRSILCILASFYYFITYLFPLYYILIKITLYYHQPFLNVGNKSKYTTSNLSLVSRALYFALALSGVSDFFLTTIRGQSLRSTCSCCSKRFRTVCTCLFPAQLIHLIRRKISSPALYE